MLFHRFSGCFGFLLITGLLTGILAAGPTSAVTKDLPAHPRILWLSGEEKAVQQMIETDAVWKEVHRQVLSECETMCDKPPVERVKIGIRLLDKSRECLRRVLFLAYAWRMTGEEKFRQRAEKEMLAVAAFSDWNPSHFLDVAEMTMGMAIGYDWLHAVLPEASRSAIREAICKKGLEPSLEARYSNWTKASHNWNQVCNAGLTFGALALWEETSVPARQIVDRALETIVLPMADYAPDGAYPEGYSYWGYGTTFNVLLLAAVEKAFGTDFDLSAKPGFLPTSDYLKHMTGPSGQCFNYSDSGSGGSLQPAMFWFAQKRKDPSLLWTERKYLSAGHAGQNGKNRFLPVTLLWGASTEWNRIVEPKETTWRGGGKNPVALMRSSWTDPDAIYIGVKGGSPSVNHSHMDLGSFVMDAGGERWAMDFGAEIYNNMETAGVKLWDMKQDSERWKVFRYNNLVHNTLTVNNALQWVDGYAPILSSSVSRNFKSVILDLSSAYKSLLSKLYRGIALREGRYVTIRDEMNIPKENTLIRWTMLTPAEVSILGPGKALLKQKGKTLLFQVEKPTGVSIKTWSTTPPKPYESPNAGTIRIGFETTYSAGDRQNITVSLIPGGTGKQPLPATHPLDRWK